MAEGHTETLAQAEYRALKSELLLRIAIQNLIILVAVVVFALFATLIFCFRDSAGLVVLAHSMSTLALALQWCHQGVRQVALKQAVLSHDRQAGRPDGWENWLPTQRPNGPLGSRWFVSTKAVFIALNASSIYLAAHGFGAAWLIASAVLLLTIYFLLTNPKE